MATDEEKQTTTFKTLGICDELLDACQKLGWTVPTPIQVETMPSALDGKDLIALAQTGSGKTGAFALPIVQELINSPQAFFACVLSPTRELAIQIAEQFEALGSEIGVKCAVLVGGVDMVQQSISQRLEKLMRDFLWEGSGEGKKNHLVKWKVVSLPKVFGGLGIGNLRKRNEALLGKWLWRFQSETNALWFKVIKSKYGQQVNGWDPKRISHGNSRNPWASIIKVWSKFEPCCSFKVGMGDRVRFWEEAWLEATPLSALFPRLFQLSQRKNATIANMCADPISLPLSWDCGFRRNLNDAEIDEYASLLNKLEGVSLSQDRRDRRSWRLESSGVFSVKSFSEHLIANPSPPFFPPSRVIWKAKAPPKVKVLVWLIAHGKVNTCDLIQRKHPSLYLSPNWCVLCKRASESLDHLFMFCPIVVNLWARLWRETDMVWENYTSVADFLGTRMKFFGGKRRGHILGSCAVMALLWVVWGERNRRVFDNCEGDSIDQIWERIRFWTSLWASTTSEFRDSSLGFILLDWKATVV